MSSLKDEQTAANSQLASIISLQQKYILLKEPQAKNMTQISNIETQIQQQEGVHKGLRLAEQTYTQEYLDRTNSPLNGGFFTRMGLGNVQNWSITMFYVTYILLFVVLIVVSLRYSTEKIKLFAAISMIGAILLIVATQMLINFG